MNLSIFKNKFFILALILLLSAIFYYVLYQPKWKYSINSLQKGDTIVALGDSLTYGYKLPPNDSYPAQLSTLLNNEYNIVNYGINGNTTEDGLRRIEEVLEKEKPKLVILSLGGNDFLRKQSQQATINNLIEIINIIKQYNSDVLLLAVPQPSIMGLYTGLNDSEIYTIISDKEKTPVIYKVFSPWLSKESYKIDTIHLNKEGYFEVAQKIKKELINNKVIN